MAEQLGPYTLERRIGSGGMADVFLARGKGAVCVIKRPHPHLSTNPDFIRMFLDEASLLAQLAHPSIARVFDLGHSGEAYYLAMEYVPGFDLMTISLEYERQGEWVPAELAAKVVSDAAAALHYAHEAKGAHGQPLNIIHRDVTPHNILVSTTGAVKLIDFGVAKQSFAMHRTGAGLVKGKYPYMAPEQVSGQTIDRRVDVYALGLVLYELLANTRAIPGDTEVEQIDNARNSRIRPIEQLRPNVPEILRRILSGCLNPQVDGRYPTALDLHNDLETWLRMENQVVGREDLLRLFRVVAADPNHQLPHAGLPGFSAEAEAGLPSDVGRATTEEVPFPNGPPSVPDTLLPVGPPERGGDVPVPVPSPQPVPKSQPGVPFPGAEIPYADTAPSMRSVQPELTPETDPDHEHVTWKPGEEPLATRQLPRTQEAPPPRRSNALPIGVASLVLVAGAIFLVRTFTADNTQGPIDPASNVRPPPPVLPDPNPRPPPEVVKPPEPVADPVPKPLPEDPAKKPPLERAVITITPALDCEVKLDGAVLTAMSAEVKPGKHTVELTATDTGLKLFTSRTLKPGERWVFAPGVATLKVDLVPFGTLKINGIELLKGFSTKTWTVWEGRYRLEAENVEAKKKFDREVQLKGGADAFETFNFLGP